MTSAFVDPPDTSMITIRRAGGTIVVRPAPRRDPPFDDEVETPPSVGHYDRPLPFERPRRPAAVPARIPTGLRAARPDPVHWGRRLLIGVIEAAAGRRPLNQLTALLSPSVARGLRHDFEKAALRGTPHWTHTAVVRSMRGCEPAEDVAELSATVMAGHRVRAVAMRLELRRGRWCCTRLVLG